MINSPVEEIKNRLDIVEVVGGYIKLQKAGVNYRAVCPFHTEKNPSFFVSPSRQSWHCFGGCQKGGDIFSFVKEIEGVEFGDALRMLAQKAGVELKRQDPKIQSDRKKLYEICELACCFFEKQLEESLVGSEAKKYLLGRGITQESLKKWRVGYAPDVWQGLSDFLTSRGYSKEEIQKAGLGLTSDRGSFFDRFRGRIIFPVFDLNSQVIGFGGRVFKSDDPARLPSPSAQADGGQAKYVNTPSTLLYDKGKTLYGLDKAKLEIRKKNFCVLVEGYIDAIMCSQSGFENVAAVSGTALTPFQLGILKRYSDNLLTAFDMDFAGGSATKRGIGMAQARGFNLKVLVMPEGKDPADVILENPKNWEEIIEKARSILQFFFEIAFARFDPKTPEGRREISKTLLPVVKTIPNRIERSYWIQELAKKFGVREEIVEEELARTKTDRQDYDFSDSPEQKIPVKKTRRDILGERIVSLAIKNSKALELLEEAHCACLAPKLQAIVTDLKNGQPPADAELANYLFMKAETEEDLDCLQEIRSCLKELENLEIKTKLDSISQSLKRAEEEKDAVRIDRLIQEFHQLANKLTQ